MSQYSVQMAAIGGLAAGVTVCLWLYLISSCELRRLRKRCRTDVEDLSRELKKAAATIGELQTGQAEAEQRACAPAPKYSMNIVKRRQILRMQGRGEPLETILAAVRVQKAEVDLLVKINRLLGEQT